MVWPCSRGERRCSFLQDRQACCAWLCACMSGTGRRAHAEGGWKPICITPEQEMQGRHHLRHLIAVGGLDRTAVQCNHLSRVLSCNMCVSYRVLLHCSCFLQATCPASNGGMLQSMLWCGLHLNSGQLCACLKLSCPYTTHATTG
jgi:hypothetical protein